MVQWYSSSTIQLPTMVTTSSVHTLYYTAHRVQLVADGPDQVHAVSRHPVKGGELAEAISQLVLQKVGRARRHGVDEDVT